MALLAGCLVSAVRAEFTFFLVDNFENGKADKWYHFGNVAADLTRNPSLEAGVQDTIADMRSIHQKPSRNLDGVFRCHFCMGYAKPSPGTKLIPNGGKN